MSTPFAPTNQALIAQDPRGRLDVLVARSARKIIGNIEQQAGVPIWNKGLGDLVEAFITEYGVPSKPYTIVDLARMCGLLPKGGRR